MRRNRYAEMVPVAEYWTVEEYEPVNPRLWAEMSPPPTRFYRRKADGVDGNVAGNTRTRAYMYGDSRGAEGRMQPDLGIGFDLRKAREKTAIGNLANAH